MAIQDITNNVWQYSNVKKIHIELSSRCNAACPGCQRFVHNSPVVNPRLVQANVSFEQFQQWFPPEVIAQVENWLFCGNYGDPMAANDIYEILEYICEYSKAGIRINTNAGLRTPELFTKIGNLFAKSKQRNREIAFSIDGLKDTNHIYRRNVVWEKVWENLMAYVSTGARTCWDFLHFKHNAHQIPEIKMLAHKYGIDLFIKNPFGVDKKAMPAFDKNFNLEYIIEHAHDNGYPHFWPAKPDYVAPMPDKIHAEGHIECLSIQKHKNAIKTEIYVDSLGRILPCCFVPGGLVPTYFEWGNQLQAMYEKIGDANNLNSHSFQEILDSGVLEVYSRSWENKDIAICWIYCGKNTAKDRIIDNLYESKK